MLRSLIIASVVLTPALAIAQQPPSADTPAVRCLLAGKSFSAGATIRASATVDVCDTNGGWAASDKPAAGCFLADNFYSVGAVVGVNNAKTSVETCTADGTWSESPASGQ